MMCNIQMCIKKIHKAELGNKRTAVFFREHTLFTYSLSPIEAL